MLNVENLHFRYSKNGNPVLNGASLELKQGEIGILLGKNGSGKNALFAVRHANTPEYVGI